MNVKLSEIFCLHDDYERVFMNVENKLVYIELWLRDEIRLLSMSKPISSFYLEVLSILSN